LVLVLLLSCVSFTAYYLRTSITVAQEQMVPALGLTFQQMGLITALGFQLPYALGQIPAGVMGDRLGAHRVLGWALVLFAVASFATGLVPAAAGGAAAFAALLAARAVMGQAQATVFPVGSMAIAHAVLVTRRTIANGVFICGSTLAAALVPLTLAPLMVAAGWRAVFHGGGILALILAIAWFRWAPDVRPVISAAPIGSQIRTAFELLRNRNVLVLSVSYALHSSVFFVFIFWFFRYLVDRRGMTILSSGLWGSVPWFTAFFAGPLCSWTADWLGARYGPLRGRRFVAMGCLIIAAILITIGIRAPGPLLAIGALSLSAGIMTGVEGPFWATITTLTPGRAGAAGGVLNLFGNLGGVVSIWAVPQMTDRWGWETTLAIWAGVGVLAALLWLLVRDEGRNGVTA
jgi:ACS family glucarate transporter-like MFS transporter